ncbi:MAG: nucleotidyltransferase domain-containing protein [Candidatus Jordarchaeaceae archaeon]
MIGREKLRYVKPILEGDFIEDKNNMIFDVKGLVHPPNRVIAYLRYYPDAEGERTRKNGQKYSKVYSLEDRENYLIKHFPSYVYFDAVFGLKLEGVPRSQIKRVYKPIDKLQKLLVAEPLDDLERDTVLFVEILREESKISINKIGVSGSILVDLANTDSDVDIIVYGEKNSRRAYEALRNLFNNGNTAIKPYGEDGLRKLYNFRAKDTLMSYEDYLFSEKRKCVSGEINGRDFFMRFIKDPSEIREKYGDTKYVSLNIARIEGIVTDDRESLFTPCKYVIKHTKTLEGEAPKISEIVSYRGRFCDQVRENEKFIAQGKVEKVITKSETYYRLLLGGGREDFLIVKRNQHK